MNLQEVLKGKGTSIKDKVFMPTEAYVEPFLKLTDSLTDDYVVQAITPNQMTYNEQIDTTYNRVWIQAVLPEINENHQEVIGMIYGLDSKGSPMKFYRGLLNMACTNLCVFNPSALHVQGIEPDTIPDFDSLKRIIDTTQNEMEVLKRMREINIHRDDKEHKLGEWMHRAFVSEYNNGNNVCRFNSKNVEKAYKDLFINSSSKYFTQENHVSMFEVYNALTQQITDTKNFMNKAEDTLLASKILNI